MTWTPTILLALAILGSAGATILFLRRASRSRRELSQRLHDTALGLDRRCDAIEEMIRALDRRQRIAYLSGLVEQGAREQRLSAPVASRLRRYVLDLHAESLLGGP